ncbi:hypothetical protein OJF2_27090 [Aquisphaera giovannonii]|uniref:Glycosyltransferase RgtA/B/C/D-like domain-containing protein n=1 Tax=Aquisphaera giovannonii TaxID=406548 RepID=A0A5B9W1R6_9BACT|nr:hypothetical protein [Aquisphaera giovannonii]QEH34174.1 hypothetical protein OJF2_27090 [Aquisphaera giovannonii]
MSEPRPKRVAPAGAGWLARPVGRAGRIGLALVILAAPAVLFFAPFKIPGTAHVARDPLSIYRLYSDDFAYVGASRTLARTASNLFVPHNTHVVPAWRVVTWALVAWSGRLANLPETLAEAAFGILLAVMILMGRLVARETGRPAIGLAAMVAVGVTSVMASPACWYSAGQTLWAAFGVLATLWYAQCWRRSAAAATLPAMALSAMFAGWCWTIGHMAGPVAAVYLWLDGRRRCRWAAAVPFGASVLAALISVALGASKVDSSVSFHGRTTKEAVKPLEGLLHTGQAIPENLVLGNLGMKAQTTAAQGLTLTALLVGTWGIGRRRRGGLAAFAPLEVAGLALVFGSYLVEWTVRGYMPFRYLRTVNLGMIVPWYDAVPQVGAVLFAAGWLAGPRGQGDAGLRVPRRPPRLSRLEALSVLGLLGILLTLNQPRVDRLWRNWVPPPLPVEKRMFPIQSMQSMRAHILLLDRAAWQRRFLGRLDLAQEAASRMGIGLASIRQAFGRIDAPELPDVYDAALLLDLPQEGKELDPDQVRRALAPYVQAEPPPRPSWLPPGEAWPPPDMPHWSETDVDAP